MATGETVTEAPLAANPEVDDTAQLERVALDFVPSADGMLLVGVYEYVPAVTGSEAESVSMLVMAFDAVDGSVVWTQQLESWKRSATGATTTVYDADEDHIVLTWGASNGSTRSHVLETATGESVWTSDEITAVAVYGGTVAAFDPGEVALGGGDSPEALLLDLDTGETEWSHEFNAGRNLTAESFGDGLARFTADDVSERGDESYETVIVDTASGGIAAQFRAPGEMRCLYDQEAIVSCHGFSKMFALDLSSGETLWDTETIGEGRALPNWTNVAYRGVLYTEYTGGSRPPLALDARTSEDLISDLLEGILEVGPGYALTEGSDEDGGIRVLEVHLATA